MRARTPQTHENANEHAVPLNVWPVAQRPAQHQRASRYPAGNRKHPGTMLPELAARIITECSRPGDLVVDPMAGSGTTLVEAADLDRRCAGVELEPRWVVLAEHNLDHVLHPEQRTLADMRRGDAQDLLAVAEDLAGGVDTVVTSPPYASKTETIDKPGWEIGGSLGAPGTRDYSDSRANVGRARDDTYTDAMSAVYAGCFRLLRPGGVLVTVTKNTREHGRLLDLAGLTVGLARAAGFTYQQHVIALHAGIRRGALVARPSLWQVLNHQRRSERTLAHLAAHEDVSIFTKLEEDPRA